MTITHFQIGDQVVRGNPNNSGYEIDYDDNSLTFEFAALEYTNPRKHQYKYKMEGFDEDWIVSGTRRFTTYTNLDQGSYIFRVKGTNNDGVWNDEGTSIRITITAPMWRTWWAYMLYVIFFFSAIYFIRRYELNRQRLKHNFELEYLKT